MDLKKARILLKKINYLFDVMNADPDNIVRIERDMMHSYIRDFYEVFFDGIVLENPGETYREKKVRKVAAEVLPQAETSTKKVVKAPKKKYATPREIIVPESLKEEIKAEKKEPVKKKEKPVAVRREPEPASLSTARTTKPAVLSKEVEKLFEFPKTKDLSDKLSSLPIASLARGISINEKILAINELFAGDAKVYNETIKKLDTLSDFSEAKKWLTENVISKYNWASAKKMKKAKVFIKLVKRRYN